MPKSNDIKKVLMLGSGPIVIRLRSLTMQARRHAVLSRRRALRLCFLTQIPQQ